MFFFKVSGDTGALPFFPTRRSSDLGVAFDDLMALGHFPDEEPDAPFNMAVMGLRLAGRSEEHTSELQSLRQLVCRLLLEKKKPIGIMATAISRHYGPRHVVVTDVND